MTMPKKMNYGDKRKMTAELKGIHAKTFQDLDVIKDVLKLDEEKIAELEAQIEKMKCGGNCKHLYHVNTGGCYDAKCDLTYCDCTNCKDEWEFGD